MYKLESRENEIENPSAAEIEAAFEELKKGDFLALETEDVQLSLIRRETKKYDAELVSNSSRYVLDGVSRDRALKILLDFERDQGAYVRQKGTNVNSTKQKPCDTLDSFRG